MYWAFVSVYDSFSLNVYYSLSFCPSISNSCSSPGDMFGDVLLETLPVSLHSFWGFMATTLLFSITATCWLLAGNPLFLLQIVFQPFFTFLSLFPSSFFFTAVSFAYFYQLPYIFVFDWAFQWSLASWEVTWTWDFFSVSIPSAIRGGAKAYGYQTVEWKTFWQKWGRYEDISVIFLLGLFGRIGGNGERANTAGAVCRGWDDIVLSKGSSGASLVLLDIRWQQAVC